jgi:DHA3 family tetracycline resistance protein-like MFS transporter
VPTGVVADLKSRRLSIIIGLFIVGLGFFVEILTPYFLVIILSQIIWGLGHTFISGALSSWISDETQNIHIEHTLITGSQMYKLFSILGLLLAGFIGMFDIQLAIAVSGILFIVLGVVAIIWMEEKHFQKQSSKVHPYQQYVQQIKEAWSTVKMSDVLKVMLVIMLFFGLFSEGIDRTHERYILDNLSMRTYIPLEPIWILSLINMLIAGIGYIVLHVVKKYIKNGQHIVLLTFQLIFMMIIGLLLYAFLGSSYLAVSSYIFFMISREASYPILDTLIVRATPSKVKATVLSGFGQLDAIGQLVSGVMMVAVISIVGLQGMYVFTAGLLVIPLMMTVKLRGIHHI